MVESGFYLLMDEFISVIENNGGKYLDKKQRPIYCCIKDRMIDNLYWAIPTSDISHRTQQQIEKYEKYINLPKKDIRSAYYHIGYTNKPALYKISNCFPITDKYIKREYISKGSHLILENKKQREEITKKLMRILAYEGRFPNRLEQHITDVKNYLTQEMQQEIKKTILPNQISNTQDFGGFTQNMN